MTRDEIYSVFDGGEAEPALLKLAVSFPEFGRRDLESVLAVLASSDEEYKLLRGRQAGASSLFFADARCPLLEAFKTLFAVMFRTGAWDDEILFQPGFLDCVRRLKESVFARFRASKYRRHGDLFEAFGEMEERLVEKIRSAPEGVSCRG